MKKEKRTKGQVSNTPYTHPPAHASRESYILSFFPVFLEEEKEKR